MSTTRILSSPGTISFRYKVSSESGYDYLRFFVDGVQQNQWSGTVDWTEAIYNLAAGTRELSWTYYKDGSVSSGSDCAWIDYIVFPASTAPSAFYPPQDLTASPGNQRVVLSWQAPVSGTPNGYKVFRNNNLLSTVNNLSYTDTAVTNGVTYNYHIVAVYSGGESDPSNTVSATPSIVTPVVITIGSGTASTSTSDGSPINLYYKSLHGQSVYTAAELNAAGIFGPVEIAQIGFNITGLPSQSMPNFVVRMKHTSAANVANWIDSTNLTTVYANASYSPTQTGWNMYNLSTPFMWNGTDNILVDTAFGLMGSWVSSGTVQYTAVTSGYRFVRDDYSDQTSVFSGGSVTTLRPNIRLVYLHSDEDAPLITVSPASITESLDNGSSISRTLTISNTGTADLDWAIARPESDIALQISNPALSESNPVTRTANWISLSSYGGIVAPGENTIIDVTLDSEGLADGTYSSSITITSNAVNNPTLSVPISLTVETPVNPYPVGPRFVAEWEPAMGAIVRYPFGQPYSLLRDLSQDALLYIIVTSGSQSAANSALQSNGVTMANVRYINAASDSYWVRDYGPWTIFDEDQNMHLVNFNYNRPRPNDNLIPSVVAGYLGKGLYDLDMNHTGGNMMTDGMGKAMSTELVLSENSTLSQAQINQRFSNYLGVTDYQIYTDPTNTYIDHIDTWAKILDVDKVIIRRVPSSHAQYAAIENSVAQWQAKTSSYDTPYRIFRVDTPNNEAYTNSFIMNGNIYVPQMGTANDAAALAVYQTAMPGFTVRGYTYSNYQSTDALHCRVNTIFDDQMIAVRHTPINDLTSYQEYTLTVEIDHHNPLDAETSFIAWSTSSSGPWQQTSLSFSGGNTYSASISSPAHLQSVYYWIQASDTSGRSTKLPLCGALDPFVAHVTVANPDLPNWTPVSYPNPPATIHAQISFFGNPALDGDLVGAFVNGECRGTGVVSTQRNAYVTMQVQLASSGETINFKIFSQADGQAYDADLVLNPELGETIGEGNPVELIFSLDKPVVSINQDGANLVLSWPEVTNADGYQILTADSPDGEFGVIDSITGTSYQINPTHSFLFFKVIAVKGNRLQLRN